jgi:hypothetical protein
MFPVVIKSDKGDSLDPELRVGVAAEPHRQCTLVRLKKMPRRDWSP